LITHSRGSLLMISDS